MDDFELFRARSLHGGVLRTEQPTVEHFDPACLDRRRAPTCGLAAKSAATRAPKVRFNNLVTDNADTSDCRTRSAKFWTRHDDVIAVPEAVRCSNAWVDFSATELPVRDADGGQKSDRWYRSRNAWMRCCERSVVGLVFPDQSATHHEFDVYRLRSFATAAGRIVNRGDYFRVRQRVHPTAHEQLERLGGPLQTASEHPVAAAPPSAFIQRPPSRWNASEDPSRQRPSTPSWPLRLARSSSGSRAAGTPRRTPPDSVRAPRRGRSASFESFAVASADYHRISTGCLLREERWRRRGRRR